MKQLSNYHNEEGFLLIAAVVLVVLVGLIVSTMMYFSAARSSAFKATQQSDKSFNVAETGQEKVKLLIDNPPASADAISCQQAGTSSNVNNINILGGQFSVSSEMNSPSQGVQLQNPLSSTDTTIRVNDASSFPTSGQVMIDLEKINYSGKSSNQLLNAQRGQEGTQAVSHRNQTPVRMFVCSFKVTGQYPASNPNAKSTLGLKVSGADVWVMGQTTTGEPLVARWTGSSWNEYSGDFNNSDELEGMTKVSYNDLWIVGADNNSAAVFNWDGNSWFQPSDSPNSGTLLNDASCISHDVCFAVGDQKDLYSINRNNWNSVGGQGQGQGNNTPPDVDYYAIDCPINPNNANDRDCWAVGQSHNDSGQDELTMIKNTGSGNSFSLENEDSTNQPITGTEDLRGIGCITEDDCWTAGDSGIVLHWDGNGWSENSSASSLTNNTLRSVYCLHTGECWIVGNTGTILHHPSGGSWSQPTSPTSNDLYAVDCSNSESCWAVGQNSTIIRRIKGQWQTESNSLPQGTLKGVVDLSTANRRLWGWSMS